MANADIALGVIVVLVVLALAFDFMHGFRDSANAIATVVSTGVLRPQQAAMFAGLLNIAAVFVFQLAVAETVGKGLVDQGVVDVHVVLGALVGAIVWNTITWVWAMPSSSTQALIGGIVGAVIAKAGIGGLLPTGLITTVVFIVMAPLLGFLLGGLMLVAVGWIFRHSPPLRVDSWFRRLQLVSAALFSLGRGGNDAQKTIGILWMLLIAAGVIAVDAKSPPGWVIWSCYLLLGLGTMLGGWRVVKSMGLKITKVKPVGGFCAETGGALIMFIATALGIPVSATHTITGATMGVGSTRSLSAVRWGQATHMVLAWAITIPVSALLAALAYVVGRATL